MGPRDENEEGLDRTYHRITEAVSQGDGKAAMYHKFLDSLQYTQNRLEEDLRSHEARLQGKLDQLQEAIMFASKKDDETAERMSHTFLDSLQYTQTRLEGIQWTTENIERLLDEVLTPQNGTRIQPPDDQKRMRASTPTQDLEVGAVHSKESQRLRDQDALQRQMGELSGDIMVLRGELQRYEENESATADRKPTVDNDAVEQISRDTEVLNERQEFLTHDWMQSRAWMTETLAGLRTDVAKVREQQEAFAWQLSTQNTEVAERTYHRLIEALRRDAQGGDRVVEDKEDKEDRMYHQFINFLQYTQNRLEEDLRYHHRHLDEKLDGMNDVLYGTQRILQDLEFDMGGTVHGKEVAETVDALQRQMGKLGDDITVLRGQLERYEENLETRDGEDVRDLLLRDQLSEVIVQCDAVQRAHRYTLCAMVLASILVVLVGWCGRRPSLRPMHLRIPRRHDAPRTKAAPSV